MTESGSVPDRRGPIFIVGAMGSGTTLLRLVLDSHPRIAIPPETGFMRAYKAHKFAPFKHSGKDWTKRLGWSPEEFRDLMRRFYGDLFMRYAEDHGKQRWGEKTPLHTWHIDDIVELFPDAQIVGMVRHPLGSAASNMTRFSTPMGKARRHWGRYARELARQAAAHPDRMVILRYEDLVRRPEEALRELLAWLGEEWSDAVLEHHTVQASRAGRPRVEGRTRRDEEIDEERVDKWTRTLDKHRQEWLATRMEALGRFFGYDTDDPRTLEPLTTSQAVLIDGDAISERIDSFDHLEIRRPREVTPYERPYDPRSLMVIERSHYNSLVEPRGLRRMMVELVRRFPHGPRRAMIATNRRVRRVLRLRPRPKKTRLY